MAHPLDGLGDEVGDVPLFVGALARDHMRHDRFCFGAPDHDALDDFAASASLVELLLAFWTRLELLELVPGLHPAARDEEVVQADDGDHRVALPAMGNSPSASEDAPLAPAPVRDVGTSVQLHLFVGGLAGIRSHLDVFGFFLDVVLDVDLVAIVLLRCWSHQSSAHIPDRRRDARATSALPWSYRSARGRLPAAYAS